MGICVGISTERVLGHPDFQCVSSGSSHSVGSAVNLPEMIVLILFFSFFFCCSRSLENPESSKGKVASLNEAAGTRTFSCTDQPSALYAISLLLVIHLLWEYLFCQWLAVCS